MIDLKERLECSKCIMDSFNDPDIKFDENGICNHCLQFDVAFNKFPKGSEKKLALESMIDKIKKNRDFFSNKITLETINKVID